MPGPRRIYLDRAASTPPLPAVVDAMARVQRESFGNPSSSHAFGPAARRALDDAREFLRGTLGAAEIVFTSGGSEADCLGIVGAASVRSPGRVLMAASDHPAILETRNEAETNLAEAELGAVSRDGDVGAETLFDALGADVRVVALMHGHNELGTLSDLEELIALVRRTSPEAHVHVDLVQTYGKIPFDLDSMDVDSVAVAGHKLHGPRGAGFLALAGTAEIAPLLPAGGQEGGLRGGTENVAGAVGLAVAAEHCREEAILRDAMARDLADLVLRRLGSLPPAQSGPSH